MNGFRKWDSLNSFHEVIRGVGKHKVYDALRAQDYRVTYGCKIKLHGTNAAVRIQPNGKIVAQRRSADIPAGTDNGGFRAWVEAGTDYWASLRDPLRTIYVWGEWAGPGIQTDVACSQTVEPAFYPFAIDTYGGDGALEARHYQPETITAHLKTTMAAPAAMHVLPYHSTVTINFGDKDETVEAVMKLNDEVEAIGNHDPLMAEMFGIDGKGEGLVCYPMVGASPSYTLADIPLWETLNFKAKAEDHRVNRSRDAVHLKAQWFPSKNAFADSFCTPQRMQQALSEAVFGKLDPKLTREFIEWVKADVFKESEAEREESNIEWTDVSGAISAAAALWYKARIHDAGGKVS
jgi:hypothetical protein